MKQVVKESLLVEVEFERFLNLILPWIAQYYQIIDLSLHLALMADNLALLEKIS